MADASNNYGNYSNYDNYGGYEQWLESEAARLVATGGTDTDTIRALLVLSCHSSPLARRFFADRLDSEALLGVLLALAVDDYSGDAQMTASYWVSQFPPAMLAPHAATLAVVAANDWDSVAIHARQALETLGQYRSAVPLVLDDVN